ncbi:hypothetical protein [Pseudomonas asiatica]|uniref:hypothetical protein n=1 Tax=Pseudomonas asiatica TaxID=2219225 RepID=UPI0010BFA99E|nr:MULTISPECIES: hypothetical protein [Pseudomonas]MBO2921325.1 hypothetical protein [Pseudomonas asiatica]WPU58777.1 hypothetical protein SQW15_18970 [Pseudomonas asiatica]
MTQVLVPLQKIDRKVHILIGAKRRYFYCAALGNLSALTALVEVIQHENEEAQPIQKDPFESRDERDPRSKFCTG